MPSASNFNRNTPRRLSAFHATIYYLIAWIAALVYVSHTPGIDAREAVLLGALMIFWAGAWAVRFARWAWRRRPSQSRHESQRESLSQLVSGVALWGIEPCVCVVSLLALKAGVV